MKNYSVNTKGSLLRNDKYSKKRRYLLVVVGVFVALIFLKQIVSTATSVITMPFFFVRHYFETSSATIPVFFRDRLELLRHIETLTDQVSAQKGNSAIIAYLTAENSELRALMQATSSPQILAGVVSRPPYTPYDTLIIDRGSVDGIVEKAPVYEGGGIAVGYVRSVFPHAALVTLFTSPEVESTVYVFGSNIFATARGDGGGILRISIPQGVPILEGSAVVLPSLEAGVLGTVDAIESNPTEPEQRAYVTLPIPISGLRTVRVGTRPVVSVTFEEALSHVKAEEALRFTVEIPEEMRMQDAGVSTSSLATSTATNTNATP